MSIATSNTARQQSAQSRVFPWLIRAFVLAATCCSTAPMASAGAIEDLMSAYTRGNELYKLGNYSAAAPLFEKAAELAPSAFGRGNRGNVHLDTAKLKEFLATCYLETFRLHEAEQLLRVCIEVGKLEEGADSPMELRCLSNLGLVYRRLNQWDQAEAMYLDVVRRDKDLQGRATTALNLGYLYMNIERPDEARRWFTESSEVWKNRTDQNSLLQLASCQHGMGMVAYREGRNQTAEQLFRSALQQRLKYLGKGHRLVGHTQGMLAAVYGSLGRDDLGRPLHRAALEALENYWGTAHVEVAHEQHDFGLMLHRTGQIDAAVQLLDATQRGIHNHIGQALQGLGQEEQLRFLTEERNRYMDAIAVALQHRDSPDAVGRSLEWTLNDKGRIHETVAERLLLGRDAALSPALRAAIAAVDAIRQRLAAATVAGGSSDEQKNIRNQLAQQEARLAQQLGLYTKHAARDARWVELTDVVRHLPDDAALVEIVRLDRSEPSPSAFGPRLQDPQGAQARYIAWVLRQGANPPVQMIDLGPAAPIDQAIRNVRSMIGDTQSIKKALEQGGEPEAEKQIKSELDRLATLAFRPLVPHFEDAKKLIFSPDGNLWLTPWNALPLEDGRYAVEKYEIRYVLSGRTLRPEQGAQATKPAQPLVLADPDFDLDPRTVGTQTSEQLRSVSAINFRSIGTYAQFPKVQRLPFTAQEARRIAPNLAKLASTDPLVYLGRNAVEAVFKSHPSPQVVVLSTHGYFLAGGNSTEAEKNPFLRCGLLLAGCNRRNDANRSGVDDGILTGLEILTADLSGTELAVLSACETGLGETRNGDGGGRIASSVPVSRCRRRGGLALECAGRRYRQVDE